jgi:N-acetylglucosamine-6-sulfatase
LTLPLISLSFLLEPGIYDYTNTTWTLNNADYKSYPGQNSINITTKNALDMLDTAVTAGNPFFLTVAPAVPHVGINASKPGDTFFPIPQYKWASAFPDAKVPRTPNWNPTEPTGVSWMLNLAYQNESIVDGMDELYRARIRCVAGLDDMVADLVAALEGYGILENTHIIYTSDNGYHISQHRLGGGKKQGLETDINIPFIWRGPGIPSGEITNIVSTHTDLVPTFLYLYGLPQRTKLDGQIIPLSKTIENATREPATEHVNVELWGAAAPYEVDPYTSIKVLGEKNNTYKGLRIVAQNYSLYYSVWCTNEHELYDMVNDPYQMTNLLPKTYNITSVSGGNVLNRPLQEVVARLDSLMMVLKSCVGAECVKPWLQLHPQGNVGNLLDALNPKYDAFYDGQPKVAFTACKLGYIVEYEGPQSALVYGAV